MMKPSIDIDTVKGFLDPKEGYALYSYALHAGALGPVLEVGSYCGKSTVYLGEACREKGVSLYAIDHHRGSEEHQPGEEYHDQDLFDGKAGLMDTFWDFRRTMRNAALEDVVVPIVASSLGCVTQLALPLSAWCLSTVVIPWKRRKPDYRSWVSHVVTDGILAIHDIFPASRRRWPGALRNT